MQLRGSTKNSWDQNIKEISIGFGIRYPPHALERPVEVSYLSSEIVVLKRNGNLVCFHSCLRFITRR